MVWDFISRIPNSFLPAIMSDSNRVKDATNRFYPVNLEVDNLNAPYLVTFLGWREGRDKQ